jgi:hypothetical protein
MRKHPQQDTGIVPQLLQIWMRIPRQGETSMRRKQSPDQSRGITMGRNEKKQKDPSKRMHRIK